MFTILSTMGLLLLGQVTKKYIIPKYGDHGLYIFLFVVALVISGVYALMTAYEGFNVIVLEAGKFLVGTIGVYEIILNKSKNDPVPADLTDALY